MTTAAPSVSKISIQDAFFAIYSTCDGAHEEDGVGFNKPDSIIARRLARRVDVWGQCEDHAAWLMLRKYSKQLAKRGITYSELSEPEKPERPASERMLAAVTGQSAFRAIFPYDPGVVAAVKRVQGARYQSNLKCWDIPYTINNRDALLEFVDSWDFELSEGAIDLLSREPSLPQYMPAGKIEPAGRDWKLIFAYDAKIVEAVKALQSRRRFDGESKTWLCEPSEQLFDFCEQFKFEGREVLRSALDQMAQQQADAALAADALSQQLIETVGDLSEPLPGGRKLVLRAHQQEAVLQLLTQRRAILAHDMGLGKSLTALVAARAAQQAFDAHVFVIAPVSLRVNWMREAEEAGVRIEFFSWAKVPKAPEGDRPFVAIFDEAHYAQSLKSNRTKAALTLADKAMLAFLLTGTPIKNGRPVNLFPLLKACQHELARDKKAYEVRYCAAKSTPWTPWDVSGAAHLDELHSKTRDVLFRKTKQQCLDLPALTRIKREAEVSEEDAVAYRDQLRELQAEYRRRVLAGEIQPNDALVLLTHLRRVGSVAKVDSAIELAEEVIEQGGQVILATQFRESAQRLADALKCESLTGETPADKRQAMVDRFQSGQYRAIVFTGGAGGVGLNLQAANSVILIDRPWTPGDAEQIESRAHRSGVNHPVTSIWLQFGEIDKKIDSLLEAKQQRIELVLEGERKTMRGVSQSAAEIAMEILKSMEIE